MKCLVRSCMALILALIVAAPASAHWGDYDAQYQVTANSAQASCNARWWCTFYTYHYHERWGDHSRHFVWVLWAYNQYNGTHYQVCRVHIYIGHTNQIWNKYLRGWDDPNGPCPEVS
jgi:hypothetical protein